MQFWYTYYAPQHDVFHCKGKDHQRYQILCNVSKVAIHATS